VCSPSRPAEIPVLLVDESPLSSLARAQLPCQWNVILSLSVFTPDSFPLLLMRGFFMVYQINLGQKEIDIVEDVFVLGSSRSQSYTLYVICDPSSCVIKSVSVLLLPAQREHQSVRPKAFLNDRMLLSCLLVGQPSIRSQLINVGLVPKPCNCLVNFFYTKLFC
jgi:hypothetical protein